MLFLFVLTSFCFFFVGVDAKYRIQERPSLLSRETESLLERRNSKCLFCYRTQKHKVHAKQITAAFMH